MSFYSYRFSVPANTPENNPVVFDCPINEKWITEIWVGFEDGCAWMVKVRVNYGIRRYFPNNPGEWIYGNDIFVPIREIIQLPKKWESIKVIACSPGAKYEHDIIIYIWTSEEEPLPLEVAMNRLVKGLGL